MDDLISRQAAIDALDVLCQEHRYKIPGKSETYSQYNEAWQDALDRAEGAIFNLPSAQLAQDLPNGCTDTISRAAVGDALNRIEISRNARWYEFYHKALTAVETLPSAQPVVISKLENATECEDAVSRFEVLRLIDYSSNDLNDSVDNWYFQGKVKELPSVTPKQPRWIPVTEKFPDNDRAVLVTLKWAEDDYEVAVGEYWHNSTASHGWGSFEGHVIAWHELPTPYREGGQNE